MSTENIPKTPGGLYLPTKGTTDWDKFNNDNFRKIEEMIQESENAEEIISNLSEVARTGEYSDLSGLPSLFSGKYDDLSGKPSLFSGSYTDLSNKPSIPTIPGVATQSTNGLMDKDDKKKLDEMSGGKKYARVVIGHKDAGYTVDEVDYLCDGTNDTALFKDALSKYCRIQSQYQSGEILILEGVYNITETLNLSSGRIHIRGANKLTTVLVRKFTGNFIEANGYGSLTIENLSFDGNKSNGYSGTMLRVGGANTTIKENIIFNNEGTGIDAYSNSGIYSIYHQYDSTCTPKNYVINNLVYKCSVGIIGSHSSYIAGNTCFHNSNDGIRGEDGGTTGSFIHIVSNTSLYNGQHGINVYGIGIIIKGNICCQNTVNGINTHAYNLGEIIISDNILKSNNKHGVYIGSTNSAFAHCIISGNLIKNNTQRGIETSLDGASITGNVIHGNSSGIYCSARAVISGNMVYRGSGSASDYDGVNRTILTSNVGSLVVGNFIPGKDVDVSSGTTTANNKVS